MNSRTLVIVAGINRQEVLYELRNLIDTNKYCTYYTDHAMRFDEILRILIAFDQSNNFDDIIFIITDEEACNIFLSYKYDEKAVLLNVIDTRALHAPSVTWNGDISELPSLIERLERNVSEHANI